MEKLQLIEFVNVANRNNIPSIHLEHMRKSLRKTDKNDKTNKILKHIIAKKLVKELGVLRPIYMLNDKTQKPDFYEKDGIAYNKKGEPIAHVI